MPNKDKRCGLSCALPCRFEFIEKALLNVVIGGIFPLSCFLISCRITESLHRHVPKSRRTHTLHLRAIEVRLLLASDDVGPIHLVEIDIRAKLWREPSKKR